MHFGECDIKLFIQNENKNENFIKNLFKEYK
jgi:hypothetical protein